MGECGARAPYGTGHDVENVGRKSASGTNGKYHAERSDQLPHPTGAGASWPERTVVVNGLSS